MRKQLEKILEEYIKQFENKHDLFFEFAVSDNLLGTICFGCVYYFNIDDIVFDIDTNQPKGLIIDWLEQSLEYPNEHINFRSYSKGSRFNTLLPKDKLILNDFFKNDRL